MKFSFEQIWIDEDTRNEPLTSEILEKLPYAKILEGPDVAEAARTLALESDPLSGGKRILRLVKHRGTFVKPCPGTPEYVCCGLKIIHVGQGCPMDCRYCALQAYFNRPVLEVFVNFDELLDEVERYLQRESGKFHRFCTGEFTDSLALDPLTGMAKRLTALFSRFKNASLEIKTKTDLIATLLEETPEGRIVLSFSVNSKLVSRKEEIRSAPLERRLAAAVLAQDRGYSLGFHFDPIIPHVGWEEAYTETIDDIFQLIAPKAIAWISLGVLRFVPKLKHMSSARFGVIPYFHDGFVRGLDGKSRLHVDRRITIYRSLVRKIRQHSPETTIYLCMESPYVWQEAMGIRMDTSAHLAGFLDAALI
ncbi:MAG: radical SAM protein [Deltaproteobacteria bacterium]|nr:radical SAM protein [Deltaproteobacteria bacterium]